MLRFECDYGEGAAPAVLELMQKTNFDQTPGYGEDSYCAAAADKIRALCDAPDAAVHFFVGATQANLTVIDAALKPWQGVLCADSGHIHVHETGAVEATGHKCLALPNKNGKITARQIRHAVEEHRANASHEHEVQPGMVYISNPTEVGTLYTKAELTDISAACYELGLYLFVDGARMAYGLMSEANDLTLLDVLDYMEEVPIVTAYRLTDGSTTTRFPMGKTLDDAQPVVEKVPGWHCDITGVRKFEDLPVEAQNYVKRLEELVGCKIKYISVSPERDACIVRE